MYFTSLPDHREPGFDEQLHFSKFKKHNIIFNATAGKSYCERHVGCLSIKTVLNGKEWYGIRNQQLAITPGQFLILNDDQEYSCKVDASEGAKILSVFFRKEFASAVLRDASCKEQNLLDNPREYGEKSPEFFQTLMDLDSTLKLKLSDLIANLDKYGYQNDTVDEHLVFLLQDLIRLHKVEVYRSNRVISVAQSTRREIYKRLCIAKDFMHSAFMDKVDLALISNTACLSTPQMIRQFKAAFQTTPHQYLTRIRLSQAAKLLKDSDKTVREITHLCGFEDTSAFCRAFKGEHGMRPMNFRNMDR